MEKKICEILNKWDPVNIKSITPDDEYLLEARQITRELKNVEEINQNNLAYIIKRVFIESFSEEEFNVKDENINEIALKILNYINKK